MFLSTVNSGLETLLIWSFSVSLWSLAIFTLLYETTAGGFAVLRPRFATAIVGHDKDKEQNLLIFGVLTAARGFSIVASGFNAFAQIDESLKVTSGYGAGKWLWVILYTGIVILVAILGSVEMFFKVSIKIEIDSNRGEKERKGAESS